MGPDERVKTDHTDWNHQSMVLSKGSCGLWSLSLLQLIH